MAQIRGVECPLGQPLVVRREYGDALQRFLAAYHRVIQRIVSASMADKDVRRVLTLPDGIRPDVESDRARGTGDIHFCRADLHLSPNGGFKVLETNANCPGGLLSSGVASRMWRNHWSDCGLELPEALDHEDENWMARWFLDAARADGGQQPDFVALLRPDGANRLELPGLAAQFRALGVEALELDPRELSLNGGAPTARGRSVPSAYLKLGMRDFSRLRPDLDAFVGSLLGRTLFVQNGFRGRWIGDNKLCLAILSDSAFSYLFDAADRALLRDRVPWSRNLRFCSPGVVRRVRGNRHRYVLKHPLDTRGRQIVFGRGSDRFTWESYVRTATREGWLVQEYCAPTELELPRDQGGRVYHDLTVGAVGGRLAAAFARSSGGLRMNVARSGRSHPVFMALSEG